MKVQKKALSGIENVQKVIHVCLLQHEKKSIENGCNMEPIKAVFFSTGTAATLGKRKGRREGKRKLPSDPRLNYK